MPDTAIHALPLVFDSRFKGRMRRIGFILRTLGLAPHCTRQNHEHGKQAMSSHLYPPRDRSAKGSVVYPFPRKKEKPKVQTAT
jgi:hypothetical protein